MASITSYNVNKNNNRITKTFKNRYFPRTWWVSWSFEQLSITFAFLIFILQKKLGLRNIKMLYPKFPTYKVQK